MLEFTLTFPEVINTSVLLLLASSVRALNVVLPWTMNTNLVPTPLLIIGVVTFMLPLTLKIISLLWQDEDPAKLKFLFMFQVPLAPGFTLMMTGFLLPQCAFMAALMLAFEGAVVSNLRLFDSRLTNLSKRLKLYSG